MDIDALATYIMVAVMVLSPILSAVLIVLTVKQKKRIEVLSIKLDEMESHMDKALNQTAAQTKDELAKQRTLLTQSLSSINDNLTRGVISMSKK